MRTLFVTLKTATKTRKVTQLVGLATAALLGGFLAQASAAEKAVPVGTTTWGGLGWGIGLAADFDTGGNRVVSADVVNNVVRVSDSSSNVNVGFVLEAHYFLRDFVVTNPRWCLTGVWCTEVGVGPFVALEIGNGSSATPDKGPITGYALGVMVGFRHHPLLPDPKDTGTSSWNFGIGLRVDPSAQILGDGIVPNQPLPAGETAIRFKKEPRTGVMLLSSFSF